MIFRRSEQVQQSWPPLVELTCVDGVSHRVTERKYAAGLVARHGRYETVCGRVVEAASMVTPPGRRCSSCDALQQVQR